ncbi:hypothetical protein B0H17DRAFT_414603 [Mycena rosella]|uniref:Uncharacterized protein n=1 Tax=Mycena rosella TaxID=1033263 RepID=A0AAD7DQL1_MYCRO|nr:hypothetical protein B0H17DRAFT_414603 [Mycena rosella]
MALPDIPELEAAARAVVYDARRKSELETLTPRMVRETLEAKFNLSEGALSSKEFRKPLKSTITAAATEEMPEVEIAPPKSKKRKSEEMSNHKPRKKQTEGPKKTAKKGDKEFKSLEMVPSSDVEDVGTQDDTSIELEKLPASEGSAKAIPPSKKPTSQKAGGSVAKRASTSAAPSDSELSVLDDEPPKRAKKAKTAKSKDKVRSFFAG